MYGNSIVCWSPALIMKLGITKECHCQKLALESRKVRHTLVYLATLLRSNNTKDVKELMAYIRKDVAKVLAARNSSMHLKENVFIFNATFSRGWCISNSILRTFRWVKIYIFLRICRSIVLLLFNDTEISFPYSLNQRSSPFFTQSPLFEKCGSKLPPQNVNEQK